MYLNNSVVRYVLESIEENDKINLSKEKHIAFLIIEANITYYYKKDKWEELNMIIFAKRINIKGVIYNLMNYNEYNKRKYSSFIDKRE